MVDFGYRLKQLRVRDGYTQKQLAEKIGVTKVSVSSMENSQSVLTLIKTKKLLWDTFPKRENQKISLRIIVQMREVMHGYQHLIIMFI